MVRKVQRGKYDFFYEPEVSLKVEQRRGQDGKLRELVDEFEAERYGFLSLTTDASTRVYDTPTGKRAHLRTLIIWNDEAFDNNYYIYDGSGTSYPLMRVMVPADDMYTATELRGFYCDKDVYVKPASYSAGGSVSIGLILEPR